MSYRTQRSLKTQRATPEEWEVSRALAAYTADPEIADQNDFVPTAVLYDTYLKWRKDNPSQVELLQPNHFGIALRRIFTDLSPLLKVQRWYAGKKRNGYRSMKGPKSIRTSDEPGRPRAPKASDISL